MNQSVYDWVGNIPLEMQAVPHFMNCQGKVPCDGLSGMALAKNDENNFVSFGDAEFFALEYDRGLGFCPRPDDPFVIIDLDGKHDAGLSEADRQGRDSLYQWAIENTYVERSISGMGVHIVIKGALPRDINKGKSRGIEAYANMGFVRLTGNLISNTNQIANAADICEWLTREYATQETEAIQTEDGANVAEWFTAAWLPEEQQELVKLLDFFRTFENGAQISRWWSGDDFADPNYSKASEDDASLLQALYKFNKNHPQRDRATVRQFLNSPRAKQLTRKPNYQQYLLHSMTKVRAWIQKEENFAGQFREAVDGAYQQAMAALEQKAAYEAQQIMAKAAGVPVSSMPPVAPPVPGMENPFKFFTASELKQRPPIEWVVDDIFPCNGLAAIYGESGAGKSFVAIDLIEAIASGRKWFGLTTKKCPVVCLALEGAGGLKQRVEGWEKQHQQAFSEEVKFYDGVFELRNSQMVGQFCAALNNGHGSFDGVVVIDTMNQASGGADENSSRDMGELLAGMREIRTRTNSLVIVVHHATKNPETQSMRGHGSFYAACDAVLEVARTAEPSIREWKAVKVKDAQDGVSEQFTMITHQLGFKPDGSKMLTSLAIEWRAPIVNPVSGEVTAQQPIERPSKGSKGKGSGGASSGAHQQKPPFEPRTAPGQPTYAPEEYAADKPRSRKQSNEQDSEEWSVKPQDAVRQAIIECCAEARCSGKYGGEGSQCAPRDSVLTRAVAIRNYPNPSLGKRDLDRAIDAMLKSGKLKSQMETAKIQWLWIP